MFRGSPSETTLLFDKIQLPTFLCALLLDMHVASIELPVAWTLEWREDERRAGEWQEALKAVLPDVRVTITRR